MLLASATLAGCGGDDETPAVCSSVDSLKASVADLKDVDLDQNALTTLQDDFTTGCCQEHLLIGREPGPAGGSSRH